MKYGKRRHKRGNCIEMHVRTPQEQVRWRDPLRLIPGDIPLYLRIRRNCLVVTVKINNSET